MRQILVVLLLISLSGALCAAETHREGYSFKNGKVVSVRDGKEEVVTAEVSLHNGARLLPDGNVVFRDGRRQRFLENQFLTFDGDFVALDATPDIDVTDVYYMEGDRVYVVQNDVPVLLTAEITLGNGSRLLPDGTIVSREGTRTRLNEGQQISKAGAVAQHSKNAHAKPAADPKLNRDTPATTARPSQEPQRQPQEQRTGQEQRPAQEQHPAQERKEPQQAQPARPSPAEEKRPETK